MANKLSAKDLSNIVQLVIKAMPQPQPVVQTQSQPVMKTHIADDSTSDVVNALDETEAELIRELSCPRILTTRGKSRTTTTNLTSQALDNVRRIRRERDTKNSVQYT